MSTLSYINKNNERFKNLNQLPKIANSLAQDKFQLQVKMASKIVNTARDLT